MTKTWNVVCVRYAARGGLIAFLLAFASVAPGGAQDPCEVMDNGSGTVTLPPAGCAYLSPQQVHAIIDGLPPGTTIELSPIHRAFFCRQPSANEPCLVEPGGGLGGQREVFDSKLVFELRGTGELEGFQRILTLDAAAETHTGPRNPGDPVQSFPTDMFQLQGAVPPGDPDFAQLQIIAGTAFGLPSPGQTTLHALGDGNFNVDSFFDISYRIDFQGAPGGALDGLAGSTLGMTRMEASGVSESRRCVADDNGTGTVTLPPDGCGYLSPSEVHEIIDGLPPGTTIELDPLHYQFFCTGKGGVCGQPGGSLGGEVELFDSNLRLHLAGTGTLASFRRTLRVPVSVETHTGPRTPGDPVQSFPTDMFRLQGQLIGDPDFAELTITGGTGNGLPSPGQTTLQDLGGGMFQVDSFFDIEYRIDFVGAPGGALEGLSGSTTATVRVEARNGKTDSVEKDNGSGTVTVPPEGGEYVSPEEVHMIIDGLPPGTTIELDPSHLSFFCDNTGCAQPGGNLGGERETFDSSLELKLTGTGSLAGFQRDLTLPAVVETHTAPRTPGDPVQSFDTDMFNLQGQLTGDPDFDQLTITAGSNNGLPSPGHTTLTDQGADQFLVDSFFDISYQIDFVGAPGGQLDGLSGSTQGSIRVEACDREGAPAHNVTIIKEADPPGPTDFSFTGDLGSFSLDDDSDATLSHRKTVNNLSAGSINVTENLPPGWVLLSIICDDPDGGTTVDVAAGQATLDLDLGEAITCTFRNVAISDLIFTDGFESGDVTAWALAVP